MAALARMHVAITRCDAEEENAMTTIWLSQSVVQGPDVNAAIRCSFKAGRVSHPWHLGLAPTARMTREERTSFPISLTEPVLGYNRRWQRRRGSPCPSGGWNLRTSIPRATNDLHSSPRDEHSLSFLLCGTPPPSPTRPATRGSSSLVTAPHLPDRWVGGLERPPPLPPRRSLPSSPRPRLGRPFSIRLHPPSRRAGASSLRPWQRSPSTSWR